MSSAAPAIPLFGDAYLADTHHLTLEEHGAYLKLLMIAWRMDDCALPDDDARLALMLGCTAAKWAKLKPAVMAFWQLSDKGWQQGRLSKERKFVEEKRAKNSSAATARWNSQVTENKQTEECERISKRISERNAPPPPPIDKKEEEEVEAAPQLRARPQPQPVSEAVEVWNDACQATGWPSVQRISETRHRALAARLRAETLEGWRSAINQARASPYLGHDPPTFFTFDWVIKSGNFLKLIEGNYDHLANGKSDDGTESVVQALARVRAEIEAEEQEARGDDPCPRLALPSNVH
jgi:uncharacterized protein YdaU (DUF1376 family)